MAISSVKINTQMGKLFERASNGNNWASRYLGKKFEQARHEPAKFASSMLLTSIVSKDVVGCIIYTYQSLHNERIPKEKRGFVASLDLMNGFLMVGGQILIGKIIEAQMTPQLFGKLFSGTFKDKNTKEETDLKGMNAAKKSRLFDDNILEKIKNHPLSKHLEPNDTATLQKKIITNIGKGSGRYKMIEAGFGILVTALVTTALVKRTLVPLISTPLAGWFSKKYFNEPKGDKAKTESKEKVKEKPNSDDLLLSHESAPWAYTSKSGYKVELSKTIS